MKVLGVGSCTLDYIGVVDRFAEPDFKVELDQMSVQGGGSAATAMVTLARWGLDVSFIGKVGGDSRGEEIIATLSGEDIDTSRMVREEGAISQVSFIIVAPDRSNKQTYYTRGNVSPLTPDEVHPDALEGVTLLHVDGSFPEAQRVLMAHARERGIPTMLDAEHVRTGLDDLVELADYVVASERFASQFTGDGALHAMCRGLLARGPRVVAVTMGSEGSVAMTRNGPMVREPAYPVRVLDRTGAGDVFHGAFIYAILNNWPLQKTVRFANAAASLACTGLGGRSRIGSLEELEGLTRETW